MPHRMPSPILPGPLTRSAAADLTQALRDLYGSLLGHFTATPPLIYQQGQGGVNYGIDLSVISWPITFTSTATFLGGPSSGGLILPLVLPGIVTVGSIYYDSNTGQIYIYNGTVWKHYGSGCWDAYEAALDADQNNYNPDDPQMNWWRLTRGSSPPNVNVTGIEERDDGCPLLITHCGHTGGGSTPNTITLTYDDAASTSINRIYNAQSNSNAVVLYSGQSVLLRYDVTSFHWRVVAVGVGPFKGSATGGDGSTGLVPRPVAAEQSMFLKAAGFWDYPLVVRKNSTGSDFSRRRLNLIEGAGATLTVADSPANDEVNVTIAVAGLTSPLTTKGDVWGYSTANARIPVGTNGQVLTADSTQALGLKWAAPSAGISYITVQEDDGTPSYHVSDVNPLLIQTGKGLSLDPSGALLIVSFASATAPGTLSATTQSIAGLKTFLDSIVVGATSSTADGSIQFWCHSPTSLCGSITAFASGGVAQGLIVGSGNEVRLAADTITLENNGGSGSPNTVRVRTGIATFATGYTGNATLAKLTPGGANGTLVITNGLVTGYTAPT
jgi:hypothetical protein